jgi:hypothetical protein
MFRRISPLTFVTHRVATTVSAKSFCLETIGIPY